MSTLVEDRMTVEAFLRWAEGRDGRWELVEGRPVMQQAESWGHARTKFKAAKALEAAAAAAGIDCIVAVDGPTVEIGQRTGYVPDIVMISGPEPDPNALVVPDPIIVVEVLSPSTLKRDMTDKLAGYFKVASIRHYLIIDTEAGRVVHHAREAGGTGLLPPAIVSEGEIRLEPPGLTVTVAALLGRE